MMRTLYIAMEDALKKWEKYEYGRRRGKNRKKQQEMREVHCARACGGRQLETFNQ
jgi:hypothetical protein